MPYALFLVSCSMGSPIFLIVPGPCIPPLSLLTSFFCSYHFSGVLWLPFYLGYLPTELWDSLSTYVHPGIACLASWASAWLGAFWASLSGFQLSVTLVKLLVIGHFLSPLGWST